MTLGLDLDPLFNYVLPVCIPSAPRKEMALFLNRLSSLVPGLHAVDADVPLDVLCKDEHKLEQVALGREFHISLGRTVPIRVHQIDSLVAMLRQKLQTHRRYGCTPLSTWFFSSVAEQNAANFPYPVFHCWFLTHTILVKQLLDRF